MVGREKPLEGINKLAKLLGFGNKEQQDAGEALQKVLTAVQAEFPNEVNNSIGVTYLSWKTNTETGETTHLPSDSALLHLEKGVDGATGDSLERQGPDLLVKGVSTSPEYVIIVDCKRFGADAAGGMDKSHHFAANEPERSFGDGKYKRVGFISHRGKSLKSGHYWAGLQGDSCNAATIYNDEKVYEVDRLPRAATKSYIQLYQRICPSLGACSDKDVPMDLPKAENILSLSDDESVPTSTTSQQKGWKLTEEGPAPLGGQEEWPKLSNASQEPASPKGSSQKGTSGKGKSSQEGRLRSPKRDVESGAATAGVGRGRRDITLLPPNPSMVIGGGDPGTPHCVDCGILPQEQYGPSYLTGVRAKLWHCITAHTSTSHVYHRGCFYKCSSYHANEQQEEDSLPVLQKLENALLSKAGGPFKTHLEELRG